MKLLFLAAVLVWGFAPQAARPANSGAAAKSAAVRANNPAMAKKTDSAPAQSPAISVVPDDQSSGLRTASGRSDLEIKLTWFAGTLAAVAVLQFFTLLWQTFSLQRIAKASSTHSQEMEYQSRVLDGQLKVMTEQLAAVKETAGAASASAVAAKESIERIISKERARLRVELQPFYLNFGHLRPPATRFSMKARPTPLWSIRTCRSMSAPRAIPIAAPSMAGPCRFPASSGRRIRWWRRRMCSIPSPRTRSTRSANSNPLCILRDSSATKMFFEGQHETRFNRVWSIARMSHLNGEPFTYWEHCGTGGRKRGNLVVGGSVGHPRFLRALRDPSLHLKNGSAQDDLQKSVCIVPCNWSPCRPAPNVVL